MKPETIENPCLICGKGSRTCGHTRQDLRNHYDRCREMRRRNKQAKPAKVKRHRVPAEGPEVFPHDESHSHVAVYAGSKMLRVRMADHPPVKHLKTDADYCGDAE
jgi:hypothetical protein